MNNATARRRAESLGQAKLKKFAAILEKSFDPLDFLFLEASTTGFRQIRVSVDGSSYDCFHAPAVIKKLKTIREKIRKAISHLNKAYALIQTNKNKDGVYL